MDSELTLARPIGCERQAETLLQKDGPLRSKKFAELHDFKSTNITQGKKEGGNTLSLRRGTAQASAALIFYLIVCVLLQVKVFTDEQLSFNSVTSRTIARPQQWLTVTGQPRQAVSEVFLLVYRLCCASIVFWCTLLTVTDPSPLQLRINETGKQIKLVRFGKLITFSQISWMLEGFFFVCASLCHFSKSTLLAKVTLVLFEICASVSILVFAIVRFVILPKARKMRFKEVEKSMNQWKSWTIHNTNIGMLLGE